MPAKMSNILINIHLSHGLVLNKTFMEIVWVVKLSNTNVTYEQYRLWCQSYTSSK